MRALGNKPHRHSEAVVQLLNFIFITISSCLFLGPFLVLRLLCLNTDIAMSALLPCQRGQLEAVPCISETPRGVQF